MRTKTFIQVFSILLCVFFFSVSAFAQTTQSSIDEINSKATSFSSAHDSIDYIKKTIPTVKDASEKRALYTFMASIQEQLSLFKDATSSYAAAAAVQVPATAETTSSVKCKSSAQLVLDAVRCALSTGDWETADKYLNSPVRNSQNEKIQATIKLYETWSSLCKIQNDKELEEPLALLKTYSGLPSMKSVQSSVLLTLWYLTSDSSYSTQIKKLYPGSPEESVVNGKAQMLPSPFWFFVPRKGNAIAKASDAEAAENLDSPQSTAKSSDTSSSTKTTKASSAESSKENASDSTSDKASSADSDDAKSDAPRRQQLGLFKSKSNADALVSSLKEKGFKAYITEETRPSGTTYYIVVVDEESDGETGLRLRSAGFECYPVF